VQLGIAHRVHAGQAVGGAAAQSIAETVLVALHVATDGERAEFVERTQRELVGVVLFMVDVVVDACEQALVSCPADNWHIDEPKRR
jgi:hypothetical protein